MKLLMNVFKVIGSNPISDFLIQFPQILDVIYESLAKLHKINSQKISFYTKLFTGRLKKANKNTSYHDLKN
jgi:hypothetical protein